MPPRGLGACACDAVHPLRRGVRFDQAAGSVISAPTLWFVDGQSPARDKGLIRISGRKHASAVRAASERRAFGRIPGQAYPVARRRRRARARARHVERFRSPLLKYARFAFHSLCVGEARLPAPSASALLTRCACACHYSCVLENAPQEMHGRTGLARHWLR